jgi:hypothetical protein
VPSVIPRPSTGFSEMLPRTRFSGETHRRITWLL